MTTLNPADLQKMTAHEVANLADLDVHAVRDEGFRRQTAAEAKIARLQKQLAKAQAERTHAHEIITAAIREQKPATASSTDSTLEPTSNWRGISPRKSTTPVSSAASRS